MEDRMIKKIYERNTVVTIGGLDEDIVLCNVQVQLAVIQDTLMVYSCPGDQSILWNGSPILSNKTYGIEEGACLKLGAYEIYIFSNEIHVLGVEGTFHVRLLEIQLDSFKFDGFPSYYRSPRIVKRVPTEKVEIKGPMEKAHMSKGDLVSMIIPPLLTTAVTVVIGFVMQMGAFMMLSGLTTVLTIIFSITRYFSSRKECREKNILREQIYEEYLLKKRKEIYQLKNQEIEAWAYNYPKINEIEKMVAEYSPRIYEKGYQDADFLTLSVGYKQTTISFPIIYEEAELQYEKDELKEEGRKIKEQFERLEEKPVVVDLKKAHLGLVGYKEYIHEQLILIITQLAFTQSYHELQVIVIYNNAYDSDFTWMKWLPHCKIKMLNVRGIINCEHMRDQILGSIHQILKDRKVKWTEKKDTRFLPHFLFVIDEPKLISSHAIMEYLNNDGEKLAFSIIYTTQQMAELPDNIGTVVELLDSENGKVILQEKQFVNERIKLYQSGTSSFEWIARNLSVLNHEQGIVTKIPESITFYDMYGITGPEQLNVEARWRKNQSYKTLSVPLGVRGNNEEVCLNLHEKAHGPHGLIAGTTGSGKSEIIQSYILSLAVNYHPHEVGFLLIDYKGGGMAGLFKNLPHLLGTITNLDGTESMRAMASIRSELLRRQELFSKYGVNHINGYNKLFKNGEATVPIPHLFLISDEFAELKKEQPDFMAELISTARIGRSLGVHLILATQKPSGVVDDQIWSNSKFKLALKVQDEADSREILKTSDAAFITQPGRAYLQVGNNEIYELFQSAWSGAIVREESSQQSVDDRVYLVNELGQGEILNEDLDREAEHGEQAVTQMEAIIEYIGNVYAKNPCEKVPKPWLPPLPYNVVTPVQGIQKNELPTISFPLGLVDIPDKQKQTEFVVDLMTDGDIGYFATSGYGKSFTLTTCILSLARMNRVSSLNFYIFDFGSNALIQLKELAHTADYITFDDVEKRNKCFKLIQEEIKERKRLFASVSAQNFSVYNKLAEQPLKAIVIVVDNLDIVKEIGVDEEEEFTRIARDGMGLGIYFIFSAISETGIRYATLNSIKVKLAGYMYDQSDINSLVGRGDYTLPDRKGRAMVKFQGINIMQLYTAVPYENDIAYIKEIKKSIGDINSAYPGEHAPKIPVLPETFYYEEMEQYEVDAGNPSILLGLDVNTVKLLGMVKGQSPFVIIGESGRGKTNIIKGILRQLNQKQQIVLFDSKERHLYAYNSNPGVLYIQSEEEVTQFVQRMDDIGKTRSSEFAKALSENSELTLKEFVDQQPPLYVIVDSADEFVEMLDKEYEDEITPIMDKAVRMGVCVIIAAHSAKLHGYSDLLGWIKNTNNGLVLGDQGSSDIFPVPYSEKISLGKGLLFRNGVYKKIMLPIC